LEKVSWHLAAGTGENQSYTALMKMFLHPELQLEPTTDSFTAKKKN
jgi:hypothetical protein